MNDRSKILTQSLIINEQYDLQILPNEVKNINISILGVIVIVCTWTLLIDYMRGRK